MSNIEEYTKNFKFMIPEFNVATWHTEIKENFKAIDALIANFVQSQQYQGAWKQVTSYIINDLVYISDEDSDYYGYLMRVKVNHTTTGDDFDTFLANNPTYYEVQGEMGAQIAALRAQDWAEKTDGMVIINNVPIDYSSKAYAVGGTGTETNNSKYFKEQAELARDSILEDPGFIAIKADFLGDETIKTVSEHLNIIEPVGNNITQVVGVYNNLSAINNCDTNMTAIQDAPTQATNAQNSAISAAQNAQLAQEAALSITNFDLFDHKWSDHLLNDQNWLRADTFSWHPATTQYGTYLEAYNHLLNDVGYVRYMVPDDDLQIKFYRAPDQDTEMYAWTNQYSTLYTVNEYPENGDDFYYNGHVFGTVLSTGVEAGSGAITPTTETIGSYTITYYPASDGHKICLPDQETTIQNIYNESGVAWYYILDTTNQRFKLPRENPAREELIQIIRAKGNGIALGLTEGTDNGGLYKGQMTSLSGSAVLLLDKGSYGAAVGQTATQDRSWGSTLITTGLTTDSTKSGIISSMKDSTSVYKGKKYLYFYIGQFSHSATEQNAGINTELFNGKMDIDMNNATSQAKARVASWGMPDYTAGVSVTYTDLNAGYEAPYDGVLLCTFGSNGTFSLNTMPFTINLDGNNKIVREIFLNQGDVIQTSNQTSAYAGTNMFFPLKGV